MTVAENDPDSQRRIGAFREGLQALGWVDGQNVTIEYRWGAGEIGRIQQYAEELVALKPDVILANSTPVIGALQKLTKTIPIVCALVNDPVGLGFVASLARPGGNITGFTFISRADRKMDGAAQAGGAVNQQSRAGVQSENGAVLLQLHPRARGPPRVG